MNEQTLPDEVMINKVDTLGSGSGQPGHILNLRIKNKIKPGKTKFE